MKKERNIVRWLKYICLTVAIGMQLVALIEKARPHYIALVFLGVSLILTIFDDSEDDML